jgi:CRISPR/Cas system-associated exonuclease Cas4 (RecB family)
MRTFLQEVAHDLFVKCNGDFSKTAIVFPNKRAGLFFNNYLAKESDSPIWAPVYVSISDLMQELSPLKLGDPILLVCILYRIFAEQTNTDEKLDHFYPWGQILISDFDDVDKNLVDADKIFENLDELSQMDSSITSFLSDAQIQALEDFFQNFSAHQDTELRQRFSSLWSKLKDIYHLYQKTLSDQNIAYEGMLYRQVIERLKPEDLPYDHYVFVGFNVLNKVENRFFSLLKEAGKAMFYWDYDIYYVGKAQQNLSVRFEAGNFIRSNILTFGNELGEEYFNHLGEEKSITLVSSSTENAQANFVSDWAQHSMQGEEKENAVVLCNESLLLPVLHSIPETVKNVNVTMGFPFNHTPIFSFIDAVFALHTDGYCPDTGLFVYDFVRTILQHPYTQHLSKKVSALLKDLTEKNQVYVSPASLKQDDFLGLLFSHEDTNVGLCRYFIELIRQITNLYRGEENKDDFFYTQLYKESLYQAYVTFNRLLSLLEDGSLQVEMKTLMGLLNSIFCMKSIPFHGEPVVGLQIMGVLETRNLDFKNLLILSLNEGQLPKAGNDISFVPYNLRKAFGMTTIEHKNAVFAYYFYRLIQRAEQVTMVYNSTAEGLSKGEMSRFILQLLVEWPHTIQKKFLDTEQVASNTSALAVGKTEEVMNRLYELFDLNTSQTVSLLSPSALNDYLDCPLRFYLRYVAKLKEPNEVSMEIESNVFGSIFHKAAEMLYKKLTAIHKRVTSEDINKLLKGETWRLEQLVDDAFKSEYFHMELGEKQSYNGSQKINYEVILAYLKQMLNVDLRYVPFDLCGQEEEVADEYNVEVKHRKIRLKMGGKIDRMDWKEGTLRIVDYKTGSDNNPCGAISDLFVPKPKRPGHIFQTFMYASLVEEKLRNHTLNITADIRAVKPALLYIRKSADEEYAADVKINKVVVDDITPYEPDFRSELENLVKTIFDSDIPFSQAEKESTCKYCPYTAICGRKVADNS